MPIEKAISEIEIEIECDCGQVVKATMRELRSGPTLTCPQGHSIVVDGSQFDRDLKPLDRELKRLDDTLDRIDGMKIGGRR
jgi:hypothetical protein